ncbi:MAG TPA: ABC transporter permease [Pirellulaceae bacterium]|nr:ABC transporter permease [Pirellulaceae bacterium]
MNRAVLNKCLVEARLLFAACAVALFAFCWVRVYIISRVDLETFSEIVEKLWDKWADFWPVSLSQLLSYSGRIAVTFDEPIVVLCVSVFAIARGSDVVSGELNRGTMELLLAQPVSRWQVLASQAIVTVAGIVLLSLTAWLGTLAGIMTNTVQETVPPPSIKVPGIGLSIPLSLAKPEKIRVPMRDKVDAEDFIPGAVNLGALGICLAGIGSLASSFDRYRWRTIGLVVGFYVVQTIFKISGMAIAEVAWLKKLTLFTAYEPQKFIATAVHDAENTWSLLMRNSQGTIFDVGPLGYNLILLGIGLGCYVAAAIVFQKRDLPAPL